MNRGKQLGPVFQEDKDRLMGEWGIAVDSAVGRPQIAEPAEADRRVEGRDDDEPELMPGQRGFLLALLQSLPPGRKRFGG